MAIFSLYDAAGLGFNMSGTNSADWTFVLNDPNVTAKLISDDGSTAYFSIRGSSLVDSFGIKYTKDGSDIIVHDAVYFKGNATILDVIDVDIRTTFASLQAGTGFTKLNAKHDEWHGNRYADIIKAGTGNDVVVGYAGNDKLYGERGNDDLYGGNGNDLLVGDAGLDYLCGDLGKDILTGGLHSDVFDFNSVQESVAGKNRDKITDFVSGVDVIDLRTIDADTDGGKGNQAFTWIGSSAFTGVDGQLRLVNGILQGDTNGDKKVDFEINVGVNKLVVTASLDTSDIWL